MNFLLVFFILLIIIIGLLFSKVIIKINNISINLNSYYKKISEEDIRISLYFFSLIKLIEIKIKGKLLYVNGIRIDINYKEYIKRHPKKGIRDIILKNKEAFIYNFRNIEIDFKYSTTNSYITALVYPTICTVLNNYINRINSIKKSNLNRLFVKPYFYDVNSLNISLKCIFDISILELLNFQKQKV